MKILKLVHFSPIYILVFQNTAMTEGSTRNQRQNVTALSYQMSLQSLRKKFLRSLRTLLSMEKNFSGPSGQFFLQKKFLKSLRQVFCLEKILRTQSTYKSPFFYLYKTLNKSSMNRISLRGHPSTEGPKIALLSIEDLQKGLLFIKDHQAMFYRYEVVYL